jgi:pyruvate kinase
MPRTQIIATLGPASSNYTALRKMFTASLDVVRLNFSHGSHDKHLSTIQLVRKLNRKYRRHIRIMQDLAGFRIRIGRFKGSKTRLLKNRTVVWLTNNAEACGPRTIPFDYTGYERGHLYISTMEILSSVSRAAPRTASKRWSSKAVSLKKEKA